MTQEKGLVASIREDGWTDFVSFLVGGCHKLV